MYVSLSNEDDGVTATEAEPPADLKYLTEAQLMAVTVGFDRNVVVPIASSMGSTFDYSAEQKKNIQRAMVGKVKSQMRLSKKTERFLQPAPPTRTAATF